MARTLDPAKRSTILNAARTILLRDGYAAAKMSDIATEAGVAPGTLYLYFDSKEVLAGAIGEDFFNRLSSQFSQVIKKLDGPDGISALMDWALGIAVKERDLLSLVRDRKYNRCHDDESKAAAQGRQRVISQLADVLDGLMAQGIIRQYDSTVNLADIVLSVLHRVLMSHAIFEDSDAEHTKTTAVTFLHHALFEDASLKAWRKSGVSK